MSDDEIPREDELEDRQGKLYPVGRALRRTFDAENHETLGTHLTGLMLELARINPDEATPPPGRGAMPLAEIVAPPAPVAPPVPPAASWWRSAVGRLLR